MSSPNFNRFSLLKDQADIPKGGEKSISSPPAKRVKKKPSVKSESPANKKIQQKENVEDGSKNRSKGKGPSEARSKSLHRTKNDPQSSPRKTNRRLVLESESDKESDVAKSSVSESIEPTPPETDQFAKCPAMNYYVGLAREHHSIPSLEELLDRAGSFGRMFENGNPICCKAIYILNIDEVYGMKRSRFQERRLQWEVKSSLIFFEQGILQQVFEREKILLFFSLVIKHRERIPNLFRLYNAVYDLDQVKNRD